MNTNFHMNGIQHAYSNLALTSSDTTLNVRIGMQHLEIPMVSPGALKIALQQLRQHMIISLDNAKTICAACNQETLQEGHHEHSPKKYKYSQAGV
jgi:hypothetical protein